MFRQTHRCYALGLFVAVCLSSLSVNAGSGGHDKGANQRKAKEAALKANQARLEAEQRRQAGIRYIQAPPSEPVVKLSSWHPGEAIFFAPSGEYLLPEELTQRENRRLSQGQQLLTPTAVQARIGVHENR